MPDFHQGACPDECLFMFFLYRLAISGTAALCTIALLITKPNSDHVPLSEPATMPLMNWRWKMTYTMTTGMKVMIAPAMSMGKSEE